MIKAWEIEKDYLLWTAGNQKSDRAIVVAHSGYRNFSDDLPVPDGVRINLFSPHNTALTVSSDDHEIEELFATSSHAQYHYASISSTEMSAEAIGAQNRELKYVTGSDKPGHIKDLDLLKNNYYEELPVWLDRNRELASEHYCDVITIRKRQPQFVLRKAAWPLLFAAGSLKIPQFPVGHPTLKNLFENLQKAGIAFSTVDLIGCRDQLKYERAVREYKLQKDSPPLLQLMLPE